jgi:hypothetical protein
VNKSIAAGERFEQRMSSAELHRLRGVFLTAMGADEVEIEASFRILGAIGVGTTDEVAPPSEPSRPISGTRLSSWWLAFKKIGKPQHALVLRRTSPPR